MKKPPKITPPEHLRPETRKWFSSVVDEYVLEPHHLRLLTMAAESWDRSREAREALTAAGTLTFEDRHGAPRPRPEVKIEQDSRILFSRLIRELGLDATPPPESRPPRIGGHRH